MRGQLSVVDGALEFPVLLLANRGDLSFDVSTVNGDALASSPYALTAAPVDGDTLADVVLVTGSLGNQAVRVYPSLGGGAFGTPAILSLTKLEAVGSVSAADLDGDLDLLCGGNGAVSSGEFLVLIGEGDGTFTEGPVVSGPLGPERWIAGLAAVADLDLDGVQDVVFPTADGRSIGVLPVPSGGFDTPRTFEVADGIYPIDLVVAEIDGDGSPEVLLTTVFRLLVLHGGGAFLDLGGGGAAPGVLLSASGGTQAGDRTELSLHVPQPGTLALVTLGTGFLVQPMTGVSIRRRRASCPLRRRSSAAGPPGSPTGRPSTRRPGSPTAPPGWSRATSSRSLRSHRNQGQLVESGIQLPI